MLLNLISAKPEPLLGPVADTAYNGAATYAIALATILL